MAGYFVVPTTPKRERRIVMSVEKKALEIGIVERWRITRQRPYNLDCKEDIVFITIILSMDFWNILFLILAEWYSISLLWNYL
jgi:hypothetical protein